MWLVLQAHSVIFPPIFGMLLHFNLHRRAFQLLFLWCLCRQDHHATVSRLPPYLQYKPYDTSIVMRGDKNSLRFLWLYQSPGVHNAKMREGISTKMQEGKEVKMTTLDWTLAYYSSTTSGCFFTRHYHCVSWIYMVNFAAWFSIPVKFKCLFLV